MTVKRAFDIAVSSIGIVLTAPVIVLTAAVMAVANYQNPLLIQERVGKDRLPFKMYKIRSMFDACAADGRLLPDAQRTTRIGALIRRARLDELPQLLNVLKGDMSIVGPRPANKTRFRASDHVRHTVRPGLTGLAQIYGGSNRLGVEESLKLDQHYARKIRTKGQLSGLFYDVGIVAVTPAALALHWRDPHAHPKPLEPETHAPYTTNLSHTAHNGRF